MAQQPLVPPSRKLASGEIPGSQSLRPSQNQALISLVRTMGDSFVQLGEQMQRAPDVDTFSMTRAAAILRQSQAAMQRMGGRQTPPGSAPVDLGSTQGRPQAPDRPVDTMTRRNPAGQLQSGMPSRL